MNLDVRRPRRVRTPDNSRNRDNRNSSQPLTSTPFAPSGQVTAAAGTLGFMARSTIFTLLAGLLLAVAPASAQRLPTTVTPRHYDLAFDVNLAAATFLGTETIDVELAEPSRRIVLHALELRFAEATITVAGATQKANVAIDVPTQTAALVVSR